MHRLSNNHILILLSYSYSPISIQYSCEVIERGVEVSLCVALIHSKFRFVSCKVLVLVDLEDFSVPRLKGFPSKV